MWKMAWVLLVVSGFDVLGALPLLKVASNPHFLSTVDDQPFFYLGDTGWELFHRLNREEAQTYLKNRAAKRFTVIQAVVLAEFEGLTAPNAYGELPLAGGDPLKPNEAYFKHVDWIVEKAEELGLYVGMLPCWGDRWNSPLGKGGIFTPETAAVYGEFLGKRYKDKAIIWVLGGDRGVENEGHRAILAAMAGGLKKGDEGRHLITFHPRGQQNSSKYFHGEKWLDFNMWQNGHCDLVPVWDRIGADYALTPVKPVIDGEPIYEDHPICFNAKDRGTSNAADARRMAWWDVMSGAAGHTYGNHAVWQFYDEGRTPVNGPLMTWKLAIDRPGAGQMQYVRNLMESRPYFLRTPDASVLALEPKSGVNSGTKKILACRASDGSYAIVYVPASRVFRVDLSKISGNVKAWWYDPRTGKASAIGEFMNAGMQEFTPADAGENVDWVLVLDDSTKGFGEPGKVK